MGTTINTIEGETTAGATVPPVGEMKAPAEGSYTASSLEGIEALLMIWARAACPNVEAIPPGKGYLPPGPIPIHRSGLGGCSPEDALVRIEDWAQLLLRLADHVEPCEDWAPLAACRRVLDADGEESAILCLSWEGRATRGRELSVFIEAAEGSLDGQICWDSGTGEPSGYLGRLGISPPERG